MPDDDNDLEIEFSPGTREQMNKDPKIAAALRDFTAAFRQANEGVKRGYYKTIEEGLESITGGRVRNVDASDLEDK